MGGGKFLPLRFGFLLFLMLFTDILNAQVNNAQPQVEYECGGLEQLPLGQPDFVDRFGNL